MKKLSIVLASLLMLLSVNVFAQDQRRGGDHEERIEKQLDHLKVMLDLTDEQLTSVKGIMENSHQELKALREDAEKEREAKQDDMKVIRTAEKEDIKVLLSADQKVKFEEMLKMHEGKMKAHKGGKKGDRKHREH